MLSMLEGGVVHALMMKSAQWDRLGQVGPAALGPGLSMVELAPGVRALAAVGGAGGVPGGKGNSLALGEEPLGSAEVERLRNATQDGGEDAGVAGDAAGLGGGELVPGVETRRTDRCGQPVMVEGDHDGGSDLAVQPVGGEMLQQLHEGLTLALCPIQVVAPEGLS
jgi:hypothetical protein